MILLFAILKEWVRNDFQMYENNAMKEFSDVIISIKTNNVTKQY